MTLFLSFVLLITGFSEVESKASTKPEANRKVNVKGFAIDSARANSANLRPPKPLQKKGYLLSYKFVQFFQIVNKLTEILKGALLRYLATL